MNLEEVLKVADKAVFNNTGKYLSDTRKRILRECWDNKTYDKIAKAIGYDSQHIKNEGNKLWKLLTDALGEKVSKSNFREALERYQQSLHKSEENSVPRTLPASQSDNPEKEIKIDALVQEVREKVKPYIKERCGTMRVLDMTQYIGLNDIYTNVNILEKISGRRRLNIELLQAVLLQNSDIEELSRFGLYVTQQGVPGLKAVQQHTKLMVLGKPGAGKTTFLKYLAIQSIEGQFQSKRFPIFISLKDFADACKHQDILEYIAQRLSNCGLTDAKVKVEQLLKKGKALILLDGLDEVQEEHTKIVLNQVQNFSDEFGNNQFVITCRIAAKEYTFQGFTEIEVADFNFQQITTFAKNWFQFHNDQVKGERFIKKLKENKPILELATNPLLLTLLCLVFSEVGNFPANRSELYKEGVDVLLKKWDIKRNIERYQVYKNLSLQRKEDLLSQIALTTFEQKDYFFKQKIVEEYIADFIYNLPDARIVPEELKLDSEAVLKSIEAQHGLLVERAKGIYSFSHLTFQEYFASREIVANSKEASLIEHITEKRWREVFLLTTGMMRKADNLMCLMKERVDNLLANNEELQQLLVYIQRKSKFIGTSYKPAAIRAFYIYLALDLTRDLAYGLANSLALDFANPLADSHDFNHALASALALDRDLALDLALTFVLAFTLDLDNDRNRTLDLPILLAQGNLKLQELLRQLKDELSNLEADSETYIQWRKENGQAWTKQLRTVIIEHRNIGHDWQLNVYQTKLLHKYIDANKLLVDCLSSDCYVSRKKRQEIEETLLLPVKKTNETN